MMLKCLKILKINVNSNVDSYLTFYAFYRDPKTIILMVWVPSTKVLARVVLSKHVRQQFFSH
jgi:hypothetical protein